MQRVVSRQETSRWLRCHRARSSQQALLLVQAQHQFHYLVRCRSVLPLRTGRTPNKSGQLWRAASRDVRKRGLPCLVQADQFCFFSGVGKRPNGACKLDESASQRPDVSLASWRSTAERFRWQIRSRTRHRRRLCRIDLGQSDCQRKVNQCEVPWLGSLVYNNVGGLDVTVDHRRFQPMQVTYRTCKLHAEIQSTIHRKLNKRSLTEHYLLSTHTKGEGHHQKM
mmetsp:Transcript_9925/g.21813  ORF Transcript_9925/g.21813 Transcript_9925/m.21813 type:complete len:224 (+) Transcript_9925:397-1068(+)